VREYGPRLLSPETLVFVFSDGLDVGDLDRLDRALRELRRRSAGIVWLNPHAGSPNFAPSAGGMRVALPYLSALLPAAKRATSPASRALWPGASRPAVHARNGRRRRMTNAGCNAH